MIPLGGPQPALTGQGRVQFVPKEALPLLSSLIELPASVGRAGNILGAVGRSRLFALEKPPRVHEASDLSVGCAELLQLTGHPLHPTSKVRTPKARVVRALCLLNMRVIANLKSPRCRPTASKNERTRDSNHVPDSYTAHNNTERFNSQIVLCFFDRAL
ncbi:hypothetical protein EYF80_044259 [Liparis tanakae]|uniref:Uncharacterized protein n=1 Tax=Liparis tanakae TaxID=230148 RepID=A0A4Z2FXR7_9TELE|nr:hypothetical protein EYF80_044259 [Liparis tanakae]